VVVQFDGEVLDTEPVERMMNLYCAALPACARAVDIVAATMEHDAPHRPANRWEPCEEEFVGMLS